MDDAPLFKITRGTPTAEELAALVGIVIGRSRSATVTRPAPTASAWSRSARPGFVMPGRLAGRPGPGAWRDSGLPR